MRWHLQDLAPWRRAPAARDGGPLWVNVASSYFTLPDYVNLDNSIFYRLQPLYPALRRTLSQARVEEALNERREAMARSTVVLHDCRRPLPFADGTVDHILCSHFLEHVHPEEALAILRDYRRALAPTGTLHLVVPDLRTLAERYIGSHAETAADEFVRDTDLSSWDRPSRLLRLLTFLGYEGLRHHWMYDEPSLRQMVEQGGFVSVGAEEVPSRDFRKSDERSLHLFCRKAK